jgi:hypothetical protein
MLRRSTWIALIGVALLAGILLYNQREERVVEQMAQSFPTLPSRFVFGDGQGTANRIKLETSAGAVIEVALNMQNDWDVILPFAGAADDGAVESAVSKISSLRFTQEVEVAPLADLGLEHPAYILTVSLRSGAEHALEIGDKTPSGSGYYARLNEKRVLILDGSGIEKLLLLIETPPYRETPTPSPLPPTAVPTHGTLFPAESITPSP